MNSLSSNSLLMLVVAIAILGVQLAAGHRIEVRRLGNRATFATGYHFYVDFNGSAGELREKVAASYQVPVEKLYVSWMGKIQPDSFNLDRFGDSSGEDKLPYMAVDFNLIKVVKSNGCERFFAVEKSDTIGDLKKKIDRMEDIPTFLQHLIRGDEELQDSVRVTSLLSEEGTVLKLVIELRQD